MIQEFREGLCSLPRVAGRGRANASSLCLDDPTLAAGDLALDRGSPPQTCRVLTLHRVVIALHVLCRSRGPAGGEVALIRLTFTPIRRIFSPVSDPIPLIRDQIALVRRVLALGCRLSEPEDRRLPLADLAPVTSHARTLPL
ncbi:MAG: hypothetical protein ACXVFQ_18035 [Solirubrobacteraceae bacterium]